jgi:4-hydroxy-2-oxovalerate aldolase
MMIDILECTLRDASYPISYQFTAEDTAIIAAGLHQAGFSRIEIGHGLGLGASGAKYGFAAATDEEYMSAASAVLSPGIFGLFAIPGIAQLKDIDLIAKYKGGFVRIGTDVTDTEAAESFIKRGKDLGLEVSSNLMKTYVATPSEVVDRSMQLQEWGADIVAVVDSAGGMMPESVRAYIAALVKAGIRKVGFHGHNNLQLAVANSIIAVEAGAIVVDSTLRGLGRSTGNAQTEALVMCLHRLGYETGIDMYQTMDISERIIAPLARGRGSDGIEVSSGYSLFHSGYMPLIEKISKTKNVDIRELIIAVGTGNGKNINEEMVSAIASGLVTKKEKMSNSTLIKRAIDSYQKEFSSTAIRLPSISSLATELNSIAKKSGQTSVLTITKALRSNNSKPSAPYIRLTDTTIIGNIEIETTAGLDETLTQIDGSVDFILMDDSLIGEFSNKKEYTSKLLYYSESNVQINALEAYLNNLNLHQSGLKFILSGVNATSLSVAEQLIAKNISVYLQDDDATLLQSALDLLNQRIHLFSRTGSSAKAAKAQPGEAVNGIIGFKVSEGKELSQFIKNIASTGFIIDANIGSFTEELIKEARACNLPIYRLDMRAGLAAEVCLRLETFKLLNHVGQNFIEEVPVVAGGIIGELGMIVLDSLSKPTKIIGVANGRGGLLSNTEERVYYEHIEKVRGYLLMQRY